MPNASRSKRDVLTIFIGSPGDLQEERREARRVVDRLNSNVARSNVARNLGLYIELRGWEDTLPGSGRPQSRINEDLRDADLFIGLVWLRWGTPTGEYTLDLTRFGGHPRVWRQSLLEGGPHAEENKVSLHRGV
jgi:hypothetical protein